MRDHTLLNADIEEGYLSSAYCTWATSPTAWDASCRSTPNESFIANPEADSMLTRKYQASVCRAVESVGPVGRPWPWRRTRLTSSCGKAPDLKLWQGLVAVQLRRGLAGRQCV